MTAYMGTYSTQTDVSHLHLDFRNGLGSSIGSAVIDDSDAGTSNVWNLNTATGAVPTGTASVRISIYGTRTSGGAGPDGYIDNVNVQIGYPALAIFVNRANGNITLKNLTGDDVNISNYSITSAFEALSPTSWLSIADNYDAGSPGPNQLDPDHDWTETSSPTGHGELSEADFQTGLGASMPNNRVLDLGNSDWIQNPNEDLVFQYLSNNELKTGLVIYSGNNNSPFEIGDLNVDGDLDVDDWVILRNNQLSDLSSLSLAQAYRVGDLTGDKLNNHADFVAFKTLYDMANGSGAFLAMVSGSVPEPSSALLVLAAGSIALPRLRRRSNH